MATIVNTSRTDDTGSGVGLLVGLLLLVVVGFLAFQFVLPAVSGKGYAPQTAPPAQVGQGGGPVNSVPNTSGGRSNTTP
jgi:hypothetical protein